MIIKPLESVSPHIVILESLLARADAGPAIKKKIEQKIRNIRAGAKGEREAAYELEFYYGPSQRWAILHDLRIECEGRVAQIDHLLINRFLDIWVCESKHFSEGLSINEHGECTAYYGQRPYGIPSPLEQNKRHLNVLEKAFKTGMLKLPRRLGVPIQPKLFSVILLSKGARITRPKTKIEGIDGIIKNDQIKSHIDKSIDSDNNPFTIAKIISTETLRDFSQQLASLHKPISFDWPSRLGLPPSPPIQVRETPQLYKSVPEEVNPHAPALRTEPQKTNEEISSTPSKEPKKYFCVSCKAGISHAEARFCWLNKPKFGGKILCRSCQKET